MGEYAIFADAIDICGYRYMRYMIYGIGLSEYGHKKKATSLRSGFWRFYRYRMISNRRLGAGVDQVSVMGKEPGAPEESAQSDVEIAGAEQGEAWD